MRLKAWRLGRRAERQAVRALRWSGLEILARNLRAGGGEIDVLARTGELVVVVEVRQRSGGILAADLSLNAAKERRLWRCWHNVRARFRIPPDQPVRFDVVLIGGKDEPVHLEGVLHRGQP